MKRPGTLRSPGSDLHRLPVGFDLRGFSIAEGCRAAVAIAAVVALNEWVGWPPLLYMALAAFLACFCDQGGPIGRRVPVLLAFTVLGATTWCGFGLLRPLGLWVAVPAACLLVFCNGFARIWGQAALALGNVLTVVLVFALDAPLSWHKAALVGPMFVAGGLWTTLLAVGLWRLYPHRLQRVAVGEAWRMLALLALDQRGLARAGADVAAWEAHARAHRRAVRDAIELAREAVLAAARGRGQVSARAAEAVMRLEVADQLFGSLIACSELLEGAGPAVRGDGARMLRALVPLLRGLGRAIAADRAVAPARVERAVRLVVVAAGEDPGLRALAAAVAERLLMAVRLSARGGYRPGGAVAGEAAVPWRERVLGPLRANLTWRSAMLRHAVRTAVVACPALLLTLSWEGVYTHWLTYTVTLTMQPFFGATWQRALERVGGTVAGCVIGGGLALLAHTPVQLTALMVPLCIVGFAARQVSYGAFIACLTPQIVVLVALVEPGHSSWEIAGMRVAFTLVGGVIAVAGSLVLWPSWEPERLREAIGEALRAHAAYAAALLGGGGGLDAARRGAGLSSNNLEASISRAMQEPRRRLGFRWSGRERPAGRGTPGGGDRLEAAMVVDAALRRLAGRLVALQHDPRGWEALPQGEREAWAAWVVGAVRAVASGEAVAARPEGGTEGLWRMGRQVELMEGALRRGWEGMESSARALAA